MSGHFFLILTLVVQLGMDVSYSRGADLDVKVPKIMRPPQEEIESSSRIATTLQRLGRNLILERTRGERDIAVFQKAAPAVVLVLAGKDSIGSGALISSDGKVITHWHVVRGHPQVVVVLKPKDSAELKKELAFTAVVEKFDQVADLALLKILSPPSSLSFFDLSAKSIIGGAVLFVRSQPSLPTT